MLKVYTDNPNFDLGISDYDLSEGKELTIYVLEENMTALSLMEAFRSCRRNPLRTYYYIPKTESNFSKYATESISRGTVNVFSDLNELRDALNSEVEAWRSYSIPECISKSADNFKIMLNRDTATLLSVAITSALNKNSCYTVAEALILLFSSGASLLVPQFNSNIEQVLKTSEKAQKANAAYHQYNSQFLSVLAAGNQEVHASWATEEYDGMALHVMFQPFNPKEKTADDRTKIISQLIKEAKQ